MVHLAGAWRLVEFELTDPSGNVIYPFGKEGIGMFVIDEQGNMSAQVMKPGRPKFSADPPPAAELIDAYSGYIAYYGKCAINEIEKIMVTRVEGSLDPNWVGSDQLRYYELRGDQLVLKTPPMKQAGIEFTGRFVWEKVS